MKPDLEVVVHEVVRVSEDEGGVEGDGVDPAGRERA